MRRNHFYSTLLHWNEANSFGLVARQNHERPQGGYGHLFPLEIGTKGQNFLEKLMSADQVILIDWLLAMPVY